MYTARFMLYLFNPFNQINPVDPQNTSYFLDKGNPGPFILYPENRGPPFGLQPAVYSHSLQPAVCSHSLQLAVYSHRLQPAVCSQSDIARHCRADCQTLPGSAGQTDGQLPGS